MEGEKQIVLAPVGDINERRVSRRVHGGLWLVLTRAEVSGSPE